MYMYNNIIHALLHMVSHVALSGLKCTLYIAAIMCKIYTSIMLQHCGRAGATQSVAMRRAAEVV